MNSVHRKMLFKKSVWFEFKAFTDSFRSQSNCSRSKKKILSVRSQSNLFESQNGSRQKLTHNSARFSSSSGRLGGGDLRRFGLCHSFLDRYVVLDMKGSKQKPVNCSYGGNYGLCLGGGDLRFLRGGGGLGIVIVRLNGLWFASFASHSARAFACFR